MSYSDLRELLAALEKNELLRHVSAEVDKNWEISMVMRWIYQGYSEDNRFAVSFDKVKGFSIPVVVGAFGGSYKTYALSLGIDPHGPKSEVMAAIRKRWADALGKPIPPVMVGKGSCQENVLKGGDINLHRFPVPVWTPEKDGNWNRGLGFLTAPCHITRDPDSGAYNMGTYRSMLRENPAEMGVNFSLGSHIQGHVKKYEGRGLPTPVATLIGVDPAVGLASATRIPGDMDELSVAGGLRGSPVEMVKCLTIDLAVPASSEIVIESIIRPRSERPHDIEGPFGEVTGYQGCATYSPVMEVQCITFRNNPIYQAYISQMPPSESSKLRHVGMEALTLKKLLDAGIEGVEDINMPESAQGRFIIVSIRKTDDSHPERVAREVFNILQPRLGKFVVVTDDDIDIYDLDNVLWALTFRTTLTPEKRDIHFIEGLSANALDYSAAPSLEAELKKRSGEHTWPGVGAFIDATRPYIPYPVVSLPPARYLEQTKKDWARYGLPKLEKEALPRTIVVEERYLAEGKATMDLMPRS
ncbi:MAG: UbiD family decarboxylase [Dehalococcoidia bacterium]|nr:UbiD family decarboxylase [Dehalococcoidia bacterium]